jgi:hypothetical protein
MLHIAATIIGYLASAFLAVSLMVNNDLKFRWINAFGCLFFIIYGAMIRAFPIVLTNAFLLCINIYYLIKIYRTHEDFDLLEFDGEEKIVTKFLNFYKDDIKNYFPDFQYHPEKKLISFIILRDMAIANIFVAELQEDGAALVQLNYTIPRYRDFKVGRYIFYKEKKFLLAKGIQRIEYESVYNKGHEKFLKVSGFEKTETGGKYGYVKKL